MNEYLHKFVLCKIVLSVFWCFLYHPIYGRVKQHYY